MSAPLDTQFRVDEGGARLDQLLAQKFPAYARTYFKDLIKRGLVTVDEAVKAPNYRLRGGEVVRVRMGEAVWADVPFEKWVLFEDPDLLILSKPSGLIVHPMGDSWINTADAALSDGEANLAGLLLKFRPEAARSGVSRCGIVHRLDRQTSGVIVTAKNPEAQEGMLNLFRERFVSKVYRAVVLGELEKSVVDAPVGRMPGQRRIKVMPWGKSAQTSFSAVEIAGGLSLIEAKPVTGRTHQIRAHASHLGHPVLGDFEAFREPERRTLKRLGLPEPSRMLLHAYRIRFEHPVTGKMISATAPLPLDFKNYWAAVKARPAKKKGV